MFKEKEMTEIAIRTNNLCKYYGATHAVDGVTIDIPSGSIVGLVGKNGAGKTTLIRLLTGLTFPTSGTIEILPGVERNDSTVAALVEKPSIFSGMSAKENMTHQCLLIGAEASPKYIEDTLKLVGLDPSNKQKIKNYSLGMRQRLAIAMALVAKPKLMLLDEPTNGLDPQGIHDMRELFVNINKEMGVTLVVSSHILSELAKFATDFIIMDQGKIVKTFTADELLNVGKKRIRLSVNDAQTAVSVLSALGKATVVGEGKVEFEGDVPPTKLLLCLAENNVQADNLVNLGDSLEDYFFDILADGSHAQNVGLDAFGGGESHAESAKNIAEQNGEDKGGNHE